MPAGYQLKCPWVEKGGGESVALGPVVAVVAREECASMRRPKPRLAGQ